MIKQKKALILINAYLQSQSQFSQAERMQEELKKLGVQADIKRNDGFYAVVSNNKIKASLVEEYDFCVSFDKDKYVSEALEKAEKMVQYSLVWKLGADKNLVITGLSDRKFTTWGIMLAEIMNDAELEKHTEAVVLTPAQGLNAMPEGELDKLSGWEE